MNYFLAALVGCCAGSLGMALIEVVKDATGIRHMFFTLSLGTAIYLVFSLPFALLGLVPVALIGEVLGRWTILHPIAISVVVSLASVPVAIWLMPGVRFTSPSLVAVSFGLLVTVAWALLSFRTDGLGSAYRRLGNA